MRLIWALLVVNEIRGALFVWALLRLMLHR
jgi:hypothetical protein